MISKRVLLCLLVELLLYSVADDNEQECVPELSSSFNETRLEDGFCISNGSDERCQNYTDDDLVITEATPPLNQTIPAPKTAQGLGNDMGEPQSLDPSYSDLIFERIEKAREYMHSKVMVEEKYKEVRSICRNAHANCAFWSVLGECENNPAYMHVNCAPVCETCEVSKSGTLTISLDAEAFYPDIGSLYPCLPVLVAAR